MGRRRLSRRIRRRPRPQLGHRGEQVVARDHPHVVAEGAAAVEDDGSVEAVATADAALGQLEVLHGDVGEHVVAVDLDVQHLDVHVVGGELTQGDEGSHAQQRADLGRVAGARRLDVLDPDARPALHDARVAAQAVCTGPVDTPAHA
jgi:hypothetical protein